MDFGTSKLADWQHWTRAMEKAARDAQAASMAYKYRFFSGSNLGPIDLKVKQADGTYKTVKTNGTISWTPSP